LGVFVAISVIAVVALIAERTADHDRGPVADLVLGDYRQRRMAEMVS
jgi:hypothetical protein